MAERFDLILSGGTVVSALAAVRADIGVCAGRIAAVGDLSNDDADEKFDVRGLHVLPGVIDTQVHFREPGMEKKEDLATGSEAAVLGGVTAVFDMPNTRPATTSAAALKDKLERAKGRMWCDHAFYVGATAANIGELAALERHRGCAGVKLFMGSSTGDLLVAEDDEIARVMGAGSRPIAVHAEDEERLNERRTLAEEGAQVRFHPVWRDEETALRATTRLLRLARKIGRRVHVLHVSTESELALLAGHRDIASVEATPQHLTLAAPECYERLGTLAQMNPPIREARHREALWRAVAEGTIDVLGSDHAPHTREEKARPYPASPSGMPGVQTLLPLMLDHLHHGRLSLGRLVELTSEGPARVFGIANKGRIEVGFDADFAVVDLDRRRHIEAGWIASRCAWTPFEGMEVVGFPVATVLRGRIIVREDELLGPPSGEPLRFTWS
jgi:dihydroorotase